jgi:hypothetical protein
MKALALAVTPGERDLLVAGLRLIEEHDGDVGRTRPLIDMLERLPDLEELRRTLGAVDEERSAA